MKMRPQGKKLFWIAPLAIVGMVLFITIGGTVVMLLWNWLAPALFHLPLVTFWQALGILVLCRILFGGFGMSGGRRSNSRRDKFGERFADRVVDRITERMNNMTPEERERFHQRMRERWGGGPSSGQTQPL